MSKSNKKTKIGTKAPSQEVKLDRKPQVIRVKLDQINLHASIKAKTLEDMSSVAHKIGDSSIFSENAIELLLKFHPVLLIKMGEQKYSCFAGLRSYQLAKRYFAPDHSIQALVYQNTDVKNVSLLAELDSYLTTLGFALDSHVWVTDVQRVWENIVHDKYIVRAMTPEVHDKNSLAQKMNINRKRLYPPPLSQHPKSMLKKWNGAPIRSQKKSHGKDQGPESQVDQEESVSASNQTQKLSDLE